jgi:hypothetical protein
VKIGWALSIAVFVAACASEGSDRVESELKKLDARAGAGVAKISRALNDPTLSSPALGEGTQLVESATQKLAQLEDDERASDFQQLMAILYQARAWDDVAIAYSTTPIPASLPPEQRALLESLLAEKAEPARLSAASSFERARERACRIGFEVSPVMSEIVIGLSRYSEDAIDTPCDHVSR